MEKPKPILIVSGETSGDTLGADLVSQLKQSDAQLTFAGMAGPKMQAAGVTPLINSEDMDIVGLTGIVSKLGDIRAAFRVLKQFITEQKPALVILIDYPGFNLRLAKFAKQQGCKVLFYVSPQIWAWRYGRIHKIKKYVDHMAVLFPFEQRLYAREQVAATYVGHPLLPKVKSDLSVSAARERLGFKTDAPVIGLLPGSRKQELRDILPTIIATAKRIRQQKPNTQFVLVKAAHLSREQLQTQLPDFIQIYEGHLYDTLRACDAVIATSGTVTFEVALMQVPLCIVYKIGRLSYWIGKQLIRIPYIGLCNVVAEKFIAKEFIQHEANAESISGEILRLLDDAAYRQQTLAGLTVMRESLADVSEQTAVVDVAKQMLATNNP